MHVLSRRTFIQWGCIYTYDKDDDDDVDESVRQHYGRKTNELEEWNICSVYKRMAVITSQGLISCNQNRNSSAV